jgi:glycerate kinase
MKIVVALDKFKGCLDSPEACRIAGAAIRDILPAAELVLKPIADGGEGSARILLSVCGGEWIPVPACGPLPGTRVTAGFAALERPARSVVETAAASGLTLLREEERDPLKTTTLGTGQLLARALLRGDPVWLALGGSATCDGGTGAARALGWRFLDSRGHELELGGGELERLARIVPPPAAAGRVEALCDVTNPLCGLNGAARVFGPQKGATLDAVKRLEAGLERLAARIHEDLGPDLASVPGGGAAGGLAAGAVAFFGATLRSGIEAILEATGLHRDLDGADWVLTGEGSFDDQSLAGKAVSGVLAAARERGVRAAILAGRIALGEAACREAGIARTFALMAPPMTAADSMAHARDLLAERAREFGREAARASCGLTGPEEIR